MGQVAAPLKLKTLNDSPYLVADIRHELDRAAAEGLTPGHHDARHDAQLGVRHPAYGKDRHG